MNQHIYLSLAQMGGRELDFVREAFDRHWVAPLGPNVDAFEQSLADYLGEGRHVVALSSGTAAIHLGLILLGVQAGDEVICQSFTFAASANPVAYLGAKPVFVDSEKDTWNMDPALLEEAIRDRMYKTGKKPKAIIAVHLYGMPAKMVEIMKIADSYEIPVIEDAAEALGSALDGRRSEVANETNSGSDGRRSEVVNEVDSGLNGLRGEVAGEVDSGLNGRRGEVDGEVDSVLDGQRCGTYGELGILSFNGNKIITTSGGGALVCRTEEQAIRTRFFATQARDQAPHYQHSHIGYNYRMSNVCAGIGRGQMLVLDAFVARRREIHRLYADLLKGLPGMTVMHAPTPAFRPNYWLTCILVDPKRAGMSREDIRLKMEVNHIETRPLWKPMHLQPVFAGAPAYVNGISEHLFDTGLCLPSASRLTDDDIRRVVEVIGS